MSKHIEILRRTISNKKKADQPTGLGPGTRSQCAEFSGGSGEGSRDLRTWRGPARPTLWQSGRHGTTPCIAVRRVRQVIAMPAFAISSADTICAPGSLPAGVVPAYLSKPDLRQCLTGAKACDALSAMRLVGTSGPNLVPLSDSARHNGFERTPASILHSLGGQR